MNASNVVDVNGYRVTADARSAGVRCADLPPSVIANIQALLSNARQVCADFDRGLLSGVAAEFGGPQVGIQSGGPELLEVFGVADARAAFVAGSAIQILGSAGPPPTLTANGATVDVVATPSSKPAVNDGSLLMSTETARRLGVVPDANGAGMSLSYILNAPLTPDQWSNLTQLAGMDLGAAESTPGSEVFLNLIFDREQGRSRVALAVYGVLLPAALILALLVALIGLALGSAESRDDQETFVAVGAGPWHRRRHNAWQAAIVTGLGAVLAIPGGLVPAAILLHNDGGDPFQVDFEPPWMALAVLAIGLPLLAAGSAALFTRSRFRAPSRRTT